MGTAGSVIYERFAPIYQQAGLAAFGRELATRIVLRYPAAAGAAALDLACGSGAATLVLARAGYRTVGLDRAAPMLALGQAAAQTQGLTVAWVTADMTEIPPDHAALPPGQFSLITCLFDSLNYLSADDDLVKVCRAVRRLLAPGGRFIFDLNTEAEYAGWNDRDVVVHDGPDLLVCRQLSYRRRARRAQGRVIWFQRDGTRWWRGEELHEERPWQASEIAAACAAADLRVAAQVTPLWTAAGPQATRIVTVLEAAR